MYCDSFTFIFMDIFSYLFFLNQLIICGGFEKNPAFFYVALLDSLSIYGLILLLGIDGDSFVLFMHCFCSSCFVASKAPIIFEYKL